MKDRLLAHFRLTFYLCLLTAGAVGLFLKDAPSGSSVLASVYQASAASYYGTLIVIVSLILLPLSAVRWTRWVLPLLGWSWLVFLVIDIAVFQIYRFHLDWMLVDMFFRDFSGMGIPLSLLAVAVLAALALLALVVWIFRSSTLGGQRWLSVFIGALCVMPVAFMVNTVINIWATHYVRDEVLVYRPYLPVYYPVESDADASRISTHLPGLFPAAYGAGDTATQRASGGLLHYPLQAPVCTPATSAPSILMIVLESWQADSLTPEIMPQLSRFAAGATRFEQHVSSGAVTVPGLFGLMYGLHPTYFAAVKSAPTRYPSQFTQTLDAQGVRTRVYTSSNLDGFSLRHLFFPRIAPNDYLVDRPDDELVERYIASLNEAPTSQRRFDFLFLTSSHASYNYPPAFTHFQPLPAIEGGFALNRQADATPYKNDYHNSLFYLDTLIGRALDAAQRQGRLENTWVIITGDHAEEFNENGLGYWGHGSNFTRWQTHTPLIVRAPGQQVGKRESRVSLHQDVVPTLMKEALGCSSAMTDYSNGTSLFSLPERRATILSSYMTHAYLVDGVVLERTVRRKYAWRDMKQAGELENPDAVRALMEEERRFIAGGSR